MCTGAELLVIGGVLKGAGAFQSGQFDAAIAGVNQDVARYQRRSALARGEEAVRQVRQQARAMIGAQGVGYASQNVLIDTGSPLEVGMDTAAQAERAAIITRENFRLEAWGYKMADIDFGLQKEQAKKGGIAGAVGGVLGGLGQAFG